MEKLTERIKSIKDERLSRLLVCAFARTVEHLLTDNRSFIAIETSERFADGLTTQEELNVASAAAWAAVATARAALREVWAGAFDATWAVVTARTAEARAAVRAEARAKVAEVKGGTAAFDTAMAAEAAWAAVVETAAMAAVAEAAAWMTAEAAVAVAEATATPSGIQRMNSILECFLLPRVQHPFPAHVVGLATTMYEKRDWSLMPILADALEEIGQDEMAAHCRQPIHARGCHVLDSILGRHRR